MATQPATAPKVFANLKNVVFSGTDLNGRPFAIGYEGFSVKFIAGRMTKPDSLSYSATGGGQHHVYIYGLYRGGYGDTVISSVDFANIGRALIAAGAPKPEVANTGESILRVLGAWGYPAE